MEPHPLVDSIRDTVVAYNSSLRHYLQNSSVVRAKQVKEMEIEIERRHSSVYPVPEPESETQQIYRILRRMKNSNMVTKGFWNFYRADPENTIARLDNITRGIYLLGIYSWERLNPAGLDFDADSVVERCSNWLADANVVGFEAFVDPLTRLRNGYGTENFVLTDMLDELEKVAKELKEDIIEIGQLGGLPISSAGRFRF